jgi:hypothetical protein
MPESDRVELRRRWNELSCSETIGEISDVPRGDRDRATTVGGVFDPLRGVIGGATVPHPIGQRLQSRRGDQIRIRRDWPIRQLDPRSRFGAFLLRERSLFQLFLLKAISLPRRGARTRRCIPHFRGRVLRMALLSRMISGNIASERIQRRFSALSVQRT